MVKENKTKQINCIYDYKNITPQDSQNVKMIETNKFGKRLLSK